MSLFDAIHNHDIEKCAKLIEEKVQINNVYQSYLTPLGLALLYEYDDIANLLRKNGASENYSMYTPWECVSRSDCYHCLKVYSRNPSFNPNQEIGYDGQTILHLAAAKPYKRAVKLLLKHGADPNQLDDFGGTPLYRAMFVVKNNGILKLLLKHGANPFASCPRSDNMFSYALFEKKINFVRIVSDFITKRNKRVKFLLLESREFDEQSLLHRDYLPLDLYRLIFRVL